MNSIYSKKIYTGRKIVADAYVVFSGNRFAGVSPKAKGSVLGKFPIITPAFVDPHSHIGMARAGEPNDQSEANDQTDSILALVDALDSVQMDDSAFKDAVEMGVLYSCVVPGSGNIIGGKSAVVRNYAKNSTAALIARAGLKSAFGFNPIKTDTWKGRRPTTRMGAFSILRAKLDQVRQKITKHRRAQGSKKKDILFSAEENVLKEVLAGKTRLRAHVHKIDDIAALLRLVDEFKIKIVVDHAVNVHEPEIFQELKRRRIPVVYGPMDCFAYKVELKHENWRNLRHLIESEVELGLMSDHPVTLARQLLVQTRWFMRAGFSKQDAIELISYKNARILGIDDRVGTIAKGKWASFICWNGDPFDLKNYPVAVYGEGELLFSD
jgi:imidazolonepropionase-like amidohydrolase